jgi:hypothetical protein
VVADHQGGQHQARVAALLAAKRAKCSVVTVGWGTAGLQPSDETRAGHLPAWLFL